MTKPGTPDPAQRATEDIASDSPGFSLSPGFVRGLTLGALVGAAIAGSAIWDRLRGRDEAQPVPEPESSPDGG